RGKKCISLCWMEVAAGRITPQRPARALKLLPRRNCQCVFEEPGQSLHGHRPRADGPDPIQIGIGRGRWLLLRGQEGKRMERGSIKAPEWIRLIGPIHISESPRIAVEVVLSLFVIPANLVLCVHTNPSSEKSAKASQSTHLF